VPSRLRLIVPECGAPGCGVYFAPVGVCVMPLGEISNCLVGRVSAYALHRKRPRMLSQRAIRGKQKLASIAPLVAASAVEVSLSPLRQEWNRRFPPLPPRAEDLAQHHIEVIECSGPVTCKARAMHDGAALRQWRHMLMSSDSGEAAVRRSFSFCTHKRNVAKDQKARNDDVAFGMKRTSKAGRAGWLAKRTSRP